MHLLSYKYFTYFLFFTHYLIVFTNIFKLLYQNVFIQYLYNNLDIRITCILNKKNKTI